MARRRTGAPWWVLLMLAVLCVLPVAAAAISQAADAGRDLLDSCWESELPEGVEPRDNTLRTVDVTAIPAGRLCDWEKGETQTGWPVTIAALVSTGIALLATAIALFWGGWRRRMLSILPLLVIGMIWLVIFSRVTFVIID